MASTGTVSTRSAPDVRHPVSSRSTVADDELELVIRARAGGADEFEQLVRRYADELLLLATRTLGDSGEAQDAVQEALVAAWRGLPELDEPAAFRAWIRHIVKRRCLNAIRTHHRRRTEVLPRADDEFDTLDRHRPISQDLPADQAQAAAEYRSLSHVLERLEPGQRACWLLREVDGLSYPEISDRIGLPASTVRGRIARARRSLAEEMVSWR